MAYAVGARGRDDAILKCPTPCALSPEPFALRSKPSAHATSALGRQIHIRSSQQYA